MKPSKERLEESRNLLRSHLVKFHDDADDDSLYMRFSEISRYLEDLESELESWIRVCNAISNKGKDK